MEKSIESIWKEGFLNQDALIAPQVNDLYNQKSIHLVDKLKRRFKANMIGLVIFSIFMLPLSIAVGLKWMGIPMFFILNIAVLYSYLRSKNILDINKSTSSYEFIKAFNSWLKQRIQGSIAIYKFLYPSVFLSMFFGFWFMNVGDFYLGEKVVRLFREFSPDLILVAGFPLLVIALVLITTAVIFYFGRLLYHVDLRIVYGGILDELEGLIREMEGLRKN